MKKIIFLFILISSTLLGAENNSNKSEFGFALGTGIGFGLTFKTGLSENTAIRFTGGFIGNGGGDNRYKSKSEKNSLNYNIASQINYSIQKNDSMNIYFSFAVTHSYELRNTYNFDPHYDGKPNKVKEYDTRGALGFGLANYFSDSLSLTLEVHQVFEYSYKPDKNLKNFYMYPTLGLAIGILF